MTNPSHPQADTMSVLGLSRPKLHQHAIVDYPHMAKDAYKVQHGPQYPPGTEYVYSNMTARGAAHFHYKDFNGKIVTAGMRGFVKKYLKDWWDRNFFCRPKAEVVGVYRDMIESVMGVGAITTDHMVALHDLGYLPLRIKALPEGRLVNLRIPLMTVINTKPEFFWLTNAIETLWSNQCWKPITTATIAYQYQQLFLKHAELTGSPLWFIPYQGHDFSARGMSGNNDSSEAGIGHLMSFVGSDTLGAGDYARQYYGMDWKKHVIMKAPRATEHAVMCANYALYGEEATYRRLLTDVYPDGMVAIVSDTWDYWNVIKTVIPALKDVILARQGNAEGPGKLVLRPDSGNPYKILCGDNDWPVFSMPMAHDTSVSVEVMHEFIHREVFKHYSFKDTEGFYTSALFREKECKYILRHPNTGEISYWAVTFPEGKYSDSPRFLEDAKISGDEVWIPGSHGTSKEFTPTIEEKGSYQALWDIFGGGQTELGFRLLNEHIGVIYGEAISLELADKIMSRMAELGFASMNAVFGIGSFTYQYLTRDTFGMAVKATWCQINGVGYDLEKHPKTDDGTKNSARGLLRVEYEQGDYVLYQEQTWPEEECGELEPIFSDGDVYNEQDLIEMREHLHPTVDWPQHPASE